MVDVVLENHDFLGLWFPQRQISWESVSSNLQLTEFAARLEDQEEHQEYDFERDQLDPKFRIGLLSRETVGSKANKHQASQLEAHLLLGLGARFKIASTQSSITDGVCRMLVGNNEGNRTKTAKATKQLPTQRSMGYRLDWSISMLENQPGTHILVILRLRTNERLPRTRAFTTFDFIVSVKCVLKLVLLVISRLRLF